MSLRGRIVAGTAVAVVLASGVLAWPLLEGAAARALERRLREETGLPWAIGNVSLALRLNPDLVARDIKLGEPKADGLTGTIRQLRLSDALALLGSGNSVRVEAEGVSLRVPSSAPAIRPTGRPAKPASMQALVRGLSAELADASRTLAVSADSTALTLELSDGAPRTEVKVRIETADYGADIAYSALASQESGPLTVTLDPRSGRGHRAKATATARFAADGLRLDAVAGTLDGAPFAGTAAVALGGARPQLGLDLRLDALTLKDEGTVEPEVRAQDGGVVVSVPPEFVPDVRWFEGFEGKGSVSVARLHVGNAGITDASLAGTVKAGTLDAALSSATLYAGQARGRYVLAPEKGGETSREVSEDAVTGRHQLSLSLAKLRALPMLWDLASVRGIDGTGTARVDLQATGNRLDELTRTLSGRAEVSLADGRIDGLDLAGAFGFLPRGNRDPGSGSLAARLDRLAGSFEVSDGQALTNDVVLKTGLIDATGIGRIDLPGRTLDFRFKPQAAGPGGGQGRTQARVDVPVRVSGPWTNPSIQADLSGIAENPGAAIQSLQDLGTNLLDKDKGGGSALDGLGNALGDLLGGGSGSEGEGGRNGGIGGLLDSFLPKPDTARPESGTPGRRTRPPEPYRAPH